VIVLQLIQIANTISCFCSLLGLISHFFEGATAEMSTQCAKETIHIRDSCLVLRNEGLQTFVHAYNVIVDTNIFISLASLWIVS